MEMTLIIGATGQLGRAAIGKLRCRAGVVRALVRSAESAARFRCVGVEAVLGDLTDADTLERACAGVTAIVATANAAVPTRSSDSFKAVDVDGYRNLIRAAVSAGVRRFVYTSAPISKHDRLSPLLQAKRVTERELEKSGLDHVIFRADIFMDTAFAMMGSEIPLRGTEGATALRPFAFANRHFARIRNSIEEKGVAMVPGDGTSRHPFICVDDVAGFLAAAAAGGPSGAYDLGGPDALTFVDVVHMYERIVGRTIAVKWTPAAVFRAAAVILKPFSPAAANLMALNYIAAIESSGTDGRAAAAFGVQLTSAEGFLRTKAAMAAAG